MEDLLEQILKNPEGTHKCPGCGSDTPNERYTVLGTVMCIPCSKQPKKIYGVMIYTEKAVATLVATEDENLFHQLKKPANQQR
jgi:hypothetical protein